VRQYTLAAVVVLVLALLLAGWRGHLGERSLWAGLAIFAAMTIAADVVLTAIGVFTYAPQFLSGIRIDRMPLEDLLYGLALYLTAVTVYAW
jgi:lycopene cyclase domain-containing protein